MPDPWHALIWPQYPLLLWLVGALRDAPYSPIARIFTRAVLEPPLQHARQGSRGPLWQHQYWDRFVRDEKECNERLEYLHLNPVKKGLVTRWQPRSVQF
jgi:hypothetical protein